MTASEALILVITTHRAHTVASVPVTARAREASVRTATIARGVCRAWVRCTWVRCRGGRASRPGAVVVCGARDSVTLVTTVAAAFESPVLVKTLGIDITIVLSRGTLVRVILGTLVPITGVARVTVARECAHCILAGGVG